MKYFSKDWEISTEFVEYKSEEWVEENRLLEAYDLTANKFIQVLKDNVVQNLFKGFKDPDVVDYLRVRDQSESD